VHPYTKDKLDAFASHYTQLFQAPAPCSPQESTQRTNSSATVQRLRTCPTPDIPDLDGCFTREELDAALRRMRNHTAPGHDALPAELLKYCGNAGRRLLLSLVNLIHATECHPTGWRQAILLCSPKAGDLTSCANYRGLSLLPAIDKLFAIMLLQRITPHVPLHDSQYGFRPGRGTADALFTMNAAVQPRFQHGLLTCLFFLDWSKAYDRVMHHAFLDRLASKGVAGKMWRLIDSMYRQCCFRVRMDGVLSSAITIHSGVAQGCPLSPFLYAVFIDGLLEVVHETCGEAGVAVGAATFTAQAYADDAAAASPNPAGLQSIIDVLKRYGDTWGCCANTDKSSILLVGPPDKVQEAQHHVFRWGVHPLRIVTEVKYLGLWLTSSWAWDKHLSATLQKGYGAFHAWRRVLASPHISVDVKLRIIDSTIRPVLEYGMEAWSPGKCSLKRRRGFCRAHASPLAHFDALLLHACRLACGIRPLLDEPAWQRNACVSADVLLSTCKIIGADSACDLAHLRYSERLRVAPSLPAHADTLFFRAAARDALQPDHPWRLRVDRLAALLPEPLNACCVPNASLTAILRDSVSDSRRKRAAAAFPPANVSSRSRRRAPAPQHINPLLDSVTIWPAPLPLLRLPPDVVYAFLTVQSCRLPFCHSVDWDALAPHGYCHRDGCEAHVHRVPAGCGGQYTETEQRWRCVQHYLFTCKAHPPSCPDPNHLWLDLLQLLPPGTVGHASLLQCRDVDSFDALSVRDTCVPWVLDPHVSLLGCSASVVEDVCRIVAAFLYLIGASVSGTPAGPARRRVQSLRLPPWSRVARCSSPSSRPLGGAEAEALSGYGEVSD
jgi:Reverse transcriptase (RNA-dependent DNA polymerase)